MEERQSNDFRLECWRRIGIGIGYELILTGIWTTYGCTYYGILHALGVVAWTLSLIFISCGETALNADRS